MRWCGGRQLCWASVFMSICSAYADAYADRPVLNAELHIRHHLIPGLKFKARNPESADAQQRQKNTKGNLAGTQNSRPPVPPPPLPSVSRRPEVISWDASCHEPLKVSIFGDYWVAPHSAGANLKESLFDSLRPVLSWADFNVVNFEGSITSSSKRAYPKYPFALKQAPDSLRWMAAAGVKHFTRANNHSMDFGWQGAVETSAAMKSVGAQYAGIGVDLKSALQPMWLEKNGLKIAVMSVTTTYPQEAWASEKNPGVAFPRIGALRKVIQSIRDDADFIVVAFHWGEELKPYLRSHQPEYAKMVIDAGADIVVGHHAHVAQQIDADPENALIVYGLGNFIFGSQSRDAKFGLGSHFEFCRTDNTADESSTHSFRMVLTPLLTHNKVTGFRTRMMSRSEFLPFAKDYIKKGYFSSELEFYLPDEGQVKSLAEWLQPRAQASK